MIFDGSFQCIHIHPCPDQLVLHSCRENTKSMGGTGAFSNCMPFAHILLQDTGLLFCTKLITSGVFVTITCREVGLQFLYSCSTFQYMQSTVPVWRNTMMCKLVSQFSFMQIHFIVHSQANYILQHRYCYTVVVSWVMAMNVSALVMRVSSELNNGMQNLTKVLTGCDNCKTGYPKHLIFSL